MPKKRFSAEQIAVLLRQIEVATAQGKSISIACREAGISEQSYFRWRKEHLGKLSRRTLGRRSNFSNMRPRAVVYLQKALWRIFLLTDVQVPLDLLVACGCISVHG
jgi:transposase-like protein